VKFISDASPESPALPIARFAPAFAWLRSHGADPTPLRNSIDVSSGHARQLIRRGTLDPIKPLLRPSIVRFTRPPQDPCGPPTVYLRNLCGVHEFNDSVALTKKASSRLAKEEILLSGYQTNFWDGGKDPNELTELQLMLQTQGTPAFYRRIRLKGRIRHLLAARHLNRGEARSAAKQGILSFYLYRIAHHERPNSDDLYDLIQMSDVARLVTQAHLLAGQLTEGLHFLSLHRGAEDRLRHPLSSRYYHQLGSIAFRSFQSLISNADQEAREQFLTAHRLAEAERQDNPHFADRHLNLLPPLSPEKGFEALGAATRRDKECSLQTIVLANCAAACGFCVEDAEMNDRAERVLHEYSEPAAQIGHQATVSKLLMITPDLPINLRYSWVRFALSMNACSYL
jgi:hypothetical protein